MFRHHERRLGLQQASEVCRSAPVLRNRIHVLRHTQPVRTPARSREHGLSPNRRHWFVITKAAPRRGEVPASYAAEQAVIAASLLDCETVGLEGVFRLLKPEDFFYEAERIVWGGILECVRNGEAVTITTVTRQLSELETIDRLDSLMGPQSGAEVYLVMVTNDWFAPCGVSAHARIIKDYAQRRAQMDRGAKIVREAYSGQARKRGWMT